MLSGSFQRNFRLHRQIPNIIFSPQKLFFGGNFLKVKFPAEKHLPGPFKKANIFGIFRLKRKIPLETN